jgi:hypothetical protein
MVRPVCVYFSVAAVLLLALGLFLPAGRTLWVMEFANGQVAGMGKLEAEEMGCTQVPVTGTQGSNIVFFTELKSFFTGGSTEMCGKSPVSMLLTGKYTYANLLLVIPVILGAVAVIHLLMRPYSRNANQRVLLVSGTLSLIILMAWWMVWVKFRAIPAIGFWMSLAGAALLLTAGILQSRIDPFRERHHPHPA